MLSVRNGDGRAVIHMVKFMPIFICPLTITMHTYMYDRITLQLNLFSVKILVFRHCSRTIQYVLLRKEWTKIRANSLLAHLFEHGACGLCVFVVEDEKKIRWVNKCVYKYIQLRPHNLDVVPIHLTHSLHNRIATKIYKTIYLQAECPNGQFIFILIENSSALCQRQQWWQLFSSLCILILSISGIENQVMQNIKTPSFTIYVQPFRLNWIRFLMITAL